LLNSKKDLKVKSENKTHKYIKSKAPRELRGALLCLHPQIVLHLTLRDKLGFSELSGKDSLPMGLCSFLKKEPKTF
jgi:hypothetical protein